MGSRFKKIILGLVIFFGVVYLGTLFLKKDYAVERSIIIKKDMKQVFDYIKYIKNQSAFVSWLATDSLTKITLRGEDGTQGYVLRWESETRGKGEQEITKIDADRQIDFTIRFEKPIESVSYSYMKVEALSDDSTKLFWGFQGSVPYPANVMMIFVNIDQAVGQELQKGLDSLKVILDKKYEK